MPDIFVSFALSLSFPRLSRMREHLQCWEYLHLSYVVFNGGFFFSDYLMNFVRFLREGGRGCSGRKLAVFRALWSFGREGCTAPCWCGVVWCREFCVLVEKRRDGNVSLGRRGVGGPAGLKWVSDFKISAWCLNELSRNVIVLLLYCMVCVCVCVRGGGCDEDV